ncbi:MAG TPA: damage-inducible protein, partial [Pseudonocardiaceae bacterium]
MADQQAAEVIRFWRTAELFAPPALERVNADEGVVALRPHEPLPWDEPPPAPEGHAWRHHVYVGVFPLDAAMDVLARVFPADEEPAGERPVIGETALAALTVGADGRLVPGTVVLSHCAWATGRAFWPGPGAADWLSGIEDARAELDSWFAERAPVDGAGRPEPLGHENLVACRDAVAALLGVTDVLPHAEIRVRSRLVPLRRAGTAPVLDSPVAEDLDLVAGRVAVGDVGAALRAYLGPVDESPRLDVRDPEHVDAVLAATAPDRVPAGRWPA